MSNIANLINLGYQIESDESGVISIHGFEIAQTFTLEEAEDILKSILTSHLARTFPPLNITVQ